jgi:excisionase family DNA binding protein
MREFLGSTFGVKELAKYLGVAEVTIYRLTERGKIPAKKVGAQWRYLKTSIDEWMRERQ